MKKIRLGDLVNTSSGATPLSSNKEYYENGDIPWINSGEVGQYKINFAEKFITKEGFEKSNTKIFPKDTILVAMYGATAGKTSILNINACTNQAVCAILPSENVNNIFLKYKLDSIYDYLVQISSGSARDNLSQKVIQDLEINLPLLETQQKIAKILSDIDDKIEVLHQINDNLAELAKTIYDYWFMQFDFPDENGKPYKTSGGKMVYNEVLKREIPEGWEVKRIEDYCKSSGGYAFKSSEWKKSGNPIIKIKNIQENNSLNIEDIDFVDMSKTIDEKFKANAGDVVIAMTGATIGKFAIVPKTDNGFYVNQRVGIFKLNEFKKLPFLINTLNQDYFRKNIIEISCGAAQPNISNEQINNIELILPISNIVEKFNSRMTICYEKIIQNRYKVYHLQSLRDWLLPMLMNGQISVE